MKESSATATMESEVKEAVDSYYSALSAMFKGNLKPIEDVWSHGDDVTLMSPSRAYPNNHRGGDAFEYEQCAKRGGRRVRYTLHDERQSNAKHIVGVPSGCGGRRPSAAKAPTRLISG